MSEKESSGSSASGGSIKKVSSPASVSDSSSITALSKPPSKTTPLASSSLPSLSSSPHVTYTHRMPYIYNQYPTTLSLILLLHIIFFYQWNTRKKRRQVQSSYHIIIHRRQFHRAIWAVLSHPASDDATSGGSSRGGGTTTAIPTGAPPTTHREGGMRHRCHATFHRLYHPLSLLSHHLLRPILPAGDLSGLPLLLYVSHLLWQLRALEEVYGAKYKNVLFTLGITSVGLDVGLTGLGITYCADGGPTLFPGPAFSPGRNPGSAASRAINRPSSGATSIVMSLLVIYGDRFPHVGISVVPLLWTAPGGYFTAGSMGFIFSTCILFVLSRRAQPLGVLTGTLAGVLFELGIVTFLALSEYWNRCLTFTVAMMCALSLRASQNDGNLIPCIDYVSWNTLDDEAHRRETPNDDDEALPRGLRRPEPSVVGSEEGEEDNFLGLVESRRLSEGQMENGGSHGPLRGRFQATNLSQDGEMVDLSHGGFGVPHQTPRGNLIDP